MTGPDWALIGAGVVGAGSAVIHGALMQRYMVRPFDQWFASGGSKVNGVSQKLTPILLHLTTAYWFCGGLALIAAALWFDESAKMATGLCVAGLYGFATIGNFVGTRGRHPGWVLYGLATALILCGVFAR